MNVSRPHFSVRSRPHSTAGIVGVALAALFLVVLGLNLWTASGGEQNGFLVVATFLTGLSALAGLVLSAVAIVRRHERSLLVVLALVVGVLVFAFLAAEIFVGHD